MILWNRLPGVLACGLVFASTFGPVLPGRAAPIKQEAPSQPPNPTDTPQHPVDLLLPMEFAHPATQSTDEGKSRLDAIVKAHGGEAFLNLKEFVLKGKGELTPPNGEVDTKIPVEALTLSFVEPSKTRLDLTTGFGDVVVSVGGDSPWYQLAGKITDVPPSVLALVSNLDPIRLLRHAAQDKLFVRDLSADSAKSLPITDGKPLTGIDITDDKKKVVQIFADKETNRVRALVTMGARGKIYILVSDYHKTADVQLPGALQVIQNKTTFLDFTFDSFEVNKPVDDTLFTRPKT